METKKKLNEVAIMQRLSDGELTHVVGGVEGTYFVQWCPIIGDPTFNGECALHVNTNCGCKPTYVQC